MTGSLSVDELYNITSRSYDTLYRDEQYRKYRTIFKILGQNSLNIVADIGCGTGLLIDYLKENNIRFNGYVCMDISKGMIRRARDKHSDNPKIVFILADAEQMPFRDTVFSEIFMITVWNNIDNKKETLKEIFRIMAGEGSAVVTILKKAKDITPDMIDEKFKAIAEDIDIIYVYNKKESIRQFLNTPNYIMVKQTGKTTEEDEPHGSR